MQYQQLYSKIFKQFSIIYPLDSKHVCELEVISNTNFNMQ